LKHLTSQNNTELKRLRLLFQKAKERKKQGVFVIEGIREIEKAILGDYKINAFFVEEGCESVYSKILNKSKEVLTFSVKKSVFEITSMRSGSEKIIAIVKSKTHTLDRLNLTDNGIILVVEAPEKPGNIGALYRTAAAAKIDSIIIANPKTDFYNPNSIRSSLGSVFLVPTALAPSFEVIAYLKKNAYKILTAAIVPKALNYNKYHYKKN
jgi:TrmH family RNA methyltransferase